MSKIIVVVNAFFICMEKERKATNSRLEVIQISDALIYKPVVIKIWIIQISESTNGLNEAIGLYICICLHYQA